MRRECQVSRRILYILVYLKAAGIMLHDTAFSLYRKIEKISFKSYIESPFEYNRLQNIEQSYSGYASLPTKSLNTLNA